MKIITQTKLKIRDQNELLNQIAGTYKDFFRAAMEYIDNAVDAASIKKESGAALKASLEIRVDINSKKVYFVDNILHNSTLFFLTYRLLYDTRSENDNKRSIGDFLYRTIFWSRLSYSTDNDNENNNCIMMRNNPLNIPYFSTTLYFISSW